MGKRWRTLDLFAGVGGIKLGFELAGFNTVFSNDHEKSCQETFNLNHKDLQLTIADINKYPIEDLPKFDILLGGFPCQPFSVAGYRKGFEDEQGRGNLFFRIAKILEIHKPLGVVLENVKNLKNHDNGKTFKIIRKTLEDLGYHVKYEILNGMIHGNIPQNRERIFIVGFLDKETSRKFKFPKPIDLTVNFRDLLEDEVDSKYYYEGKFLYPRLKDEVISFDTVYQWRRQYVRSNKRGVCPTLTANMGTGGHNVPIILDKKGIRKLTPLECFRLQGFPMDWKIPKNLSDAKLYKQAGNSVNVPVIQRIAEEIGGVLNDQL
jgi:DNA (cytosine-5)-methyltransferase 1